MINEIINAFLEVKGLRSRHGSKMPGDLVINGLQSTDGSTKTKYTFIERGAETSYKNSELTHSHQVKSSIFPEENNNALYPACSSRIQKSKSPLIKLVKDIYEHRYEIEEVFDFMGTSPEQGLSDDDAALRLERFGLNKVTQFQVPPSSSFRIKSCGSSSRTS
jgi:hypothetical protein